MDKAGNVRRYESVLVRRTYRDGQRVRHQTLANLSKLPAEVIAVIEVTLKGQALGARRERAVHHHPARCRTDTWRRWLRRWRTSWACPACWGRRAGHAIWCWR